MGFVKPIRILNTLPTLDSIRLSSGLRHDGGLRFIQPLKNKASCFATGLHDSNLFPSPLYLLVQYTTIQGIAEFNFDFKETQSLSGLNSTHFTEDSGPESLWNFSNLQNLAENMVNGDKTGNGAVRPPKPLSLKGGATAKYRHVAAVHSVQRASCLSHDSEAPPSFLGFRNLMVIVLSEPPRELSRPLQV